MYSVDTMWLDIRLTPNPVSSIYVKQPNSIIKGFTIPSKPKCDDSLSREVYKLVWFGGYCKPLNNGIRLFTYILETGSGGSLISSHMVSTLYIVPSYSLT